MPDMTGSDFLADISKLYPDTICILLTDYTESHDIIDATHIGHICQYITKPFQYQVISNILGNACQVWDLKNANKKLILQLQEKNEELKQIKEQLTFADFGEHGHHIKPIAAIQEKQVEDAIWRSEEHFRKIIELSPIAYAMNDEQENVTYLNPAFIKTFGYDKSDIPTLKEWWPLAYPDIEYRNWVAETWTIRLEKAKKEHTEFEQMELNIRSKDGTNKVVLVRAGLFDDYLKDVHLVIFDDITQRKQTEIALRKSEEKYRTIFENVQDVFFQSSITRNSHEINASLLPLPVFSRAELINITLPNQGNITRNIVEISPSILSLSGFNREEFIGFSTDNLYYNLNDREELLSNLIKTGEIRDYEIRIRTKNGAPKYASISAHLVFDASGNPIQIEGIMRDVTERKEYELEIKTQNKKLQIQNKELEQFTYVSSHDLQEPLRTLISISELIKEEFEGKIDPQADIYLDFISQSAMRMQELVKGLMNYSRIGKEQGLAFVDCKQIVSEVISDLSLSIKESNAQITVADLPKLNGYPIELRQLFQNLISNALKFRKKSVAPEIMISAKEQANNWLFSVQDNGIGIAEKNKDKIFVIFKRLHNRADYEGTGIGLSYCKKIVELHGGNIWVDSKQEEGSTFNFTIPIV